MKFLLEKLKNGDSWMMKFSKNGKRIKIKSKNEIISKMNLVSVNNLKAVKELSEYFQTHGIIKEQTIFF